MSISLTSRNTLADRFISRSLATDIALVVADERLRQRLDITGLRRALRVHHSINEA